MNKTIAITINTSWNIFNFRVGLLKALQNDGYHIVCIAPRDEYSKRLEALGFEYRHIDIDNRGSNPFLDMKLIYQLYHIYKEINPDVILHYTIKPNIYGSIAGGLLGMKMISNISGLGTIFLNQSFSSRVGKWLYRVALKYPKVVFFQNREDRELFVNLELVSKEKIDILAGSGVDMQMFKAPYKKKIYKKRLAFLFIARLLTDKGIMEFVEASAMLPNSDFYILGEYYPNNPTAITPKQMQKWTESFNLIYLGSTDSVKEVIDSVDCVVLPSYREGLSRVLLESASMAKPIVTTNVAGCKEVVDDGVNGFLCKPKDKVSLARTMKKMIDLSHKERQEMGIRGREKVAREFDEKFVIDRYKKAIRELES
ncbi:MAG: glycosyltransferase family 4 protein [Sulfurovum sp.]